MIRCLPFILCLFFYGKLSAQSLKTDTLEARRYIQSAAKNIKAKNYKTAILKFDKAINIYQDYELWDIYFKTRVDIAGLEYKAGKAEQAYQTLEDIIEESLERLERPNLGESLALHQKANLLKADNSLEAATKNFALSIALYEKLYQGKASEDYLQCLVDFAKLLQQESKYKEAIIQLKVASSQALSLYGELDERFISLWEKIAVLHYNNEHYISCKNQARRVLRIRQKADDGDSPSQYSLYFLLGKSYLFINDPKTAQKYAEKALEICEKNKDMKKAWAADFYQILADTYWQVDEFQKGIDLIQKKKKPIVANLYGSRSPNIAEVYHSLGLYYSDWDKYMDAEENFNKAIRIYKALNTKGEHLSMIYRNQAISFNRQNLYQEALEANKEAFLANCPSCPSLSNDRYFNQIRALITEQPTLNPIVRLQILQDQIQILYYQFLEEKKISTLEIAEQVVSAAIVLTEQLIKEIGETTEKEIIHQSARQSMLWGIAIYHELAKAKKDSKFIELAFQLAEIDKSIRYEYNFHNHSPQHFGFIPDSLIQLEVEAQEKLLSAKKRYTKSLLKKDEVHKTLYYNEEVKSKRELEELVDNNIKKYPNYKSLKSNFEKIDISRIQNDYLDNETSLIEYFVWEDIVYVFSLNSTEITMFEVDLMGISLKAQVEEFKVALGDPLLIKRAPKVGWENLVNSSFELGQIFINPVLNQLSESISQLIIIPDGYLYDIPFDCLLLEDARFDSVYYKDLHYLIQDFTVSYQYSAAEALVLNEIDKSSEKITATVFETNYKTDLTIERDQQVSDKRRPVTSINWTENISNRLQAIFPTEIYLNENATEYNFKSNIKNADIIHLSLFGQTDLSNLMSTALIFTEDGDSLEDNILRMEELSKLKLQAQLVVLSACEAAFGDYNAGQGIQSFSQTLHFAKVPTVVLNRWLTNKPSTTMILESFYQNLAKGMTKDMALQKAKKDYIKAAKDKMVHPFYWASLSLYGDRGSLQISKESYTAYSWSSNFLVLGIGGGILTLLAGMTWFLWKRKKKKGHN